MKQVLKDREQVVKAGGLYVLATEDMKVGE